MIQIPNKVLLPLFGMLLMASSITSCDSDDSNNNDTTTIPPTVTLTAPVDLATNVPMSDIISATFSKEMDETTIIAANFTVEETVSGNTVTGVVSYDAPNNMAVFSPAANLAENTSYTATITTGVMDLDDYGLENIKVWTFVTATLPSVQSTTPVDLATNVGITDKISATFSKEMDHATVVAANFTLEETVSGNSLSGFVTYDAPNKMAVFSPAANLIENTSYTATITMDVMDIDGNGLENIEAWTFVTAAAGAGPAPVSLGSAGNYVILAKTAISTVPTSVITGDIGLSPAAESFMTGFSQTKATGYSTCDQVTGFMYAADMTPPTPTYMTTAISDMETAYTDAAGRTVDVILDEDGGSLDGNVFAPGLYRWTSSVNVLNDITISGTGGTNDVWIFQVTGNLDLASAKSIILASGAQAKNIFWQVTGTVTMGTTSHFEGIVFSQTNITMNTGSTMNGRLFAQSDVSLDQATVTKP